MNDCAILLLGATGDLARHKIFPSLYRLFKNNKLGNSIIIGAALDDISVDALAEKIKPQVNPDDQESWKAFVKRLFYQPINFSKQEDFDALCALVATQEKKAKLSGNRLVYCSIAPYFFCEVTNEIARSGIIKRMKNPTHPEEHKVRLEGWQRIVYEKPFGSDLHSAHEINECIKQHFQEHQIFRIDHYLTKELVGNIALVRFTNIVFEPLWNNRYIDQVQIVFDEERCLDGRALFYDKYGAMSDVMQNHMMQLVALIAMESPEKLTGEHIRTERAKVLQKVKVIDAIRGQYNGYLNEKGVMPGSQTETFAQVMLRIENPRWAGVPFFLRTGKCLNKKETAIYIKFKHVDCLLSKACPSESNFLKIEISPSPVFSLTLNAKKPGKSDEVTPVQMQFAHEAFAKAPEAYETLFEEILKGEPSVSVRFDEIEDAWKIIDAVRALKNPLYFYDPKSTGPIEAKTIFDKKHGVRWISQRETNGVKS